MMLWLLSLLCLAALVVGRYEWQQYRKRDDDLRRLKALIRGRAHQAELYFMRDQR